MHVFRLTGGEEWWVGETAESVTADHVKVCGLNPKDYGASPDDWEQLDDGAPLSIFDEEDRKRPKTTKTCAEWAASNGPGLLASTEF